MPTYANNLPAGSFQGGPGFLSAWDQMNTLLQQRQQQANLGRIPGAADLESQSSLDIAQLLNPPTMFADTSRQAGELGSARGISGSAAAFGTGLRMTDEERLKRIALGQQMLTAAYGRNPSAPLTDPTRTFITPEQQAQLNLQQQAQDLQLQKWDWQVDRLNQPSFTYSGGGGRAAGGRLTGDMLSDPNILEQLQGQGYYQMPPSLEPEAPAGNPYANWPTSTDIYDPTGGYLPLYPGGEPVGGSAFDFTASDPFAGADFPEFYM